MRLPYGLLINVSLGAIRSCLKNCFLGGIFREWVPPKLAKSISRLLDVLAS